MMLIIENFLDYIYNDNIGHNNKIVYIAVGSAAHMARTMNEQRVIEIDYDQQYPMFLRTMRQKHPGHKIYIVLIDPCIESPPYTASRKKLDGGLYDDNWARSPMFENVYTNTTETIELLSFKIAITYDKREKFYSDNTICIEEQLNTLNNIAMIDKWFVIVMDYSGRSSLYELALKYDNEIKNHTDHIFYGLPTRIDGGCYVELSNIYNTFVTTREKGYLTAFAPFSYSIEELKGIYHKLSSHTPDEESHIKLEQTKMCIRRLIECFKGDILMTYRRILLHKEQLLKGEPGFDFEEDITYLVYKYNITNIRRLARENLSDIIIKLLAIINLEFYNIVLFFDKFELYSEYTECIRHIEPYKMFQSICEILNRITV